MFMIDRVYIFVEPYHEWPVVLHSILLASKSCPDKNLRARETFGCSQHYPFAEISVTIPYPKRLPDNL